jgi:UDP-glucose 4-epimerase
MSTSYKKAVVLGAGGFIGVHLVNELTAQGYDVVCFDLKSAPDWPDSAIKIQGDFHKPPLELLDQMDNAIVFHLISVTRPSMDTERIADAINQDLVATVQCLESTKQKNIRWVFVSSGGTIYGDAGTEPITEDTPPNPICSYGLIKLTLENYFSLYRRLCGTDYVVVRPSNPYGPGQDPLRGQGLIPCLIYKALQNEPVEIWGDGTVVRDYIYISDTIDGIIAAATRGHSGEIYNIGTGIGHSINQLIDLMKHELKITLQTAYTQSRSVDVQCNILNAGKLMAHTSAAPRTDILSGMKHTLRQTTLSYTESI